MQPTGTTAPLIGTIHPKCSFSDRVLEISPFRKIYLTHNTALIYRPALLKHHKKIHHFTTGSYSHFRTPLKQDTPRNIWKGATDRENHPLNHPSRLYEPGRKPTQLWKLVSGEAAA